MIVWWSYFEPDTAMDVRFSLNNNSNNKTKAWFMYVFVCCEFNWRQVVPKVKTPHVIHPTDTFKVHLHSLIQSSTTAMSQILR